MPVSWLPTTIPSPWKPIDQRSGAFTWVTPGSTVSGRSALRIANESSSTLDVESSQFEASLDSITLTSGLAAMLVTRARPPEWTTISLATQNDLYDTPWASSAALIGACVRAAVCLSVL